MKNSFLSLFTYNREANNKFIQVFENNIPPPEEPLSIISHIINTHLIWLDRSRPLDGQPIPGIWEQHSIDELSALNEVCFKETRARLNTEPSGTKADRLITYKNSKGAEYKNTIEEIYNHILMHSMYHRGQVAKLFRQEGIEPPVTDFIMHMRDLRKKGALPES